MEIIIAIVASGLLTTVITLFATRKNRESEQEKIEADAAGAISEAWSRLTGPLVDRVKALECESINKETEANTLRNRVKQLEDASQTKQAEIIALQERVTELEQAGLEKDRVIESQLNRIRELESEVGILKKQLEELGQKPRTKKS